MENNTQVIDRYLQNEMSAGERSEFETRLAIDRELQEEVRIQQQVVRAIDTAGLKIEFGKAINKSIFTGRFIKWGLIIAVVSIALIVFQYFGERLRRLRTHTEATSIELPGERLEISTNADTIIETQDGVIFAIPAHAFIGSSEKIQLEIKTALTPDRIMESGLSTMSNGELLQTAGMFYINGFENGRPLRLLKDIEVSVPTTQRNPSMQLFDGVEDKDGNVNWVNPRVVENRLRTYDIGTLDFYPPNYIPTLKALQNNYQDKRYTDSLYYSFSGFSGTSSPGAEGFDEITGSVNDYVPMDTLPNKDTSGKLADSSKKSDQLGTDLFHYEIDPARIRAIWDPKFNNTIIATKEFEERLKYIHGLCDPRYLNAYLDRLDKPLYEIDQYCADISQGDTKRKFLEFAARKNGGVAITNSLQQRLSDYVQQKYLAYKGASEKTWEKYESDFRRLNAIADTKKRVQALNDFKRQEANFDQEFCSNLTEAYRQIGVSRKCIDSIPQPAPDYYTVTISTTGWKNLDAYVFNATMNRESMEYTDPVTGKTAKLTYNEVTILLENQPSFYDRVFVYLIPDSLSSFQRVRQDGNSFKEKLNTLFRYDAVVLAYKDSQVYFHRQKNLQPGTHEFGLLPVSKESLFEELKFYSKTKLIALRNEFEYRTFEQREMIRQMQWRKNMEFRQLVSKSIFTCDEDAIRLKPDGAAIFRSRCASCHIMGKDASGPDLVGVVGRWGNNITDLKQYITNWTKAVVAGIPRAVEVTKQPGEKPIFEGINTDSEIEAVLEYIREWKPANK